MKILNLFIKNSLFLVAVITGCALTPGDFQKPNPESFYKRNLEFQIDSKDYIGHAVVPLKQAYKMKIDPSAKSEFARVNTCHRETVYEDPGYKFKFEYEPTAIEMEPGCPMDVIALDTKREHQWAHIEFMLYEKIMMKTVCNGVVSNQFGVSICQSRQGLAQQVVAPFKVKWKSNCAQLSTKDDVVFEYKAPRGFCQVLFYISGDIYHRHVIIGYDDILFGEL